ncbi:MAG: asparagine synthase (glutamine-hydrolyzing) [Candidatus Omnitrophica bacterium CG07_land_8_20_14_0_80_42_15]|uniref:asparagine synthase (glutamine-hydrolyzing) n=1 Tax=Candidatus Aquitaenariimonas noxiae TaxID=1974741 RepID=A0A2J0KR50_9BACT|nr:MAG: asparagine synthase (glutamine-hydrolyzing) [Candidatus Omnitrophica bacterium CG07_land_8_20_14_0_80_42_15]
MCGICGIVNKNVDDVTLRSMCKKLTHRGPDDEGIYISHGTNVSVGLGHRRLSIIDLSMNAHQPISNEDGTAWLIINGEIYNYQKLREQLELKGHRFRSSSDSEVVIHLYEDFGEKCLLHLRGAFAFAIWDEKQDKLFLARDRIGKKPIIYYYDGQTFCFASEFSALLESGFVKKEINYEAIHHYLTFGYVPAPNTIYKKVFKLLPAHYCSYQNGKLDFTKYWDLDYANKIVISEEEAAIELIKILKEATRLRLISDVPLGAFLSGGVDSSAVVALMSQLTNKVKTFSIGFEDEDFNELKYARNVAKKYATDHKEFIVKPKALEILPLLVERYGEPYADSSAIPTYYVSKETSKYVKVALNGDGGDESFAGYERYQVMKIAEKYNRLPAIMRNIITQMAMRVLPDSVNFKDKRRRLRRFLENISAPFYSRYCHWVSLIDDISKNSLYSENFKMWIETGDCANWIRDFTNLPHNMELVDRLMAIDIKTNLANDLVVKMDIASMANSIETRSPFLDQEVMQFAARLPANFKLKGSVKKYILKKGLKDLVPRENMNRPKMGFGVPVGRWLRGELKGYTQEVLLSKNSLNRGYFDQEKLKYYINEHIDGKKDHGYGVWALLMLELWHQIFIDKH